MTGLRRVIVVLAIAGYTGIGSGQTPATEPVQSAPAQDASQAAPAAAGDATVAPNPSASPASSGQAAGQATGQATGQAAAPATKTYAIPAGTRVLLQLRSAINTKSAKAGDGVYLASAFPVVVGNRVMIPAGVYVQGVVDRVVRAGRVKGKAQLDMHFTSMIFPNGTVVEIPGVVEGLPGAKKQSVKDNGEGTIEQDGEKGRNAGEVAKIAIPTGGTVGAIGGLAGGHPIAGGVVGIAAGLAAVGVASLFTRGADVDIASGSQVEMVLQRPLLLEEENLSAAVTSGGFAAGAALVPSANQPRPLGKPANPRSQIICPPGSLGCQ